MSMQAYYGDGCRYLYLLVECFDPSCNEGVAICKRTRYTEMVDDPLFKFVKQRCAGALLIFV